MPNKEKPKYGSLEYHLNEAVASIEKARTKAIEDVAEIEKVSPLVKFDAYPKSFDSYYGGNYYSPFDSGNESHIEKAYSKALEAIEQAHKRNEEIRELNSKIIETNLRVRKSVSNMMEAIGIPTSYSVWETPKGKRKASWVSHNSGYLADLERYAPVTDQYEFQKRTIETSKRSFEETRKRYLDNILKTKKEKEAKDKEVLKAAAALNFAKENGIEVPEGQDLVTYISEVAKEAWIKNNCKNGTELSGGCQECDTWTIGDHRCHCGNRRIYLEVEGNFFDGFYANAVAY